MIESAVSTCKVLIKIELNDFTTEEDSFRHIVKCCLAIPESNLELLTVGQGLIQWSDPELYLLLHVVVTAKLVDFVDNRKLFST